MLHIMNAESRQKVEDLVPRLWLWAPALAKGIDRGVRFQNGALDEMLELVTRIIVRTGQRMGQQSHVQAIEEIGADIVQARSARSTWQRREAFRQVWEKRRERMLEIVVYQNSSSDGLAWDLPLTAIRLCPVPARIWTW
jgi:hypothetical protein